MLPILGFLFKNPIAKLVVDKTIGAVQHHLEVKKIERIAEIEAAKTVQLQQVISSEKSWKDEWLTLFFSGLLGAHFIPYTQPFMLLGWDLLKNAPSEFWWIILTIVSGSFGMNIMDKFKK